jgi:hypothetical protein
MAHKVFPQVASLPTIKTHKINHDDIPLRNIQVDSLRNLPPRAGPYAKRISTSEGEITRAAAAAAEAGKWTPISVSSDEEDEEKNDTVNHQLRGMAYIAL